MDQNYKVSEKERSLVDAYFEKIENSVYGAEDMFYEKGGLLLKAAVKQILYSRTDEDRYLKRFFGICKKFSAYKKAEIVFKIYFSSIVKKSGDYYKLDFDMLRDQYRSAVRQKVFSFIMNKIVNFEVTTTVTKPKKVTRKQIVGQVKKWLNEEKTILTDLLPAEKEQLTKLLECLEA